MVTSTSVGEGGLHQHLDLSIDLLERMLFFLLVFCYPLFMINIASTLAIAKLVHLFFCLDLLNQQSNATFCGNQQIGGLGGNSINLTSELIFLFVVNAPDGLY